MVLGLIQVLKFNPRFVMLRLVTRMFSYLMVSAMVRVSERVGKVYCSNSFKIFHTKLLVSGVGYLYSLDYLLLINLK